MRVELAIVSVGTIGHDSSAHGLLRVIIGRREFFNMLFNLLKMNFVRDDMETHESAHFDDQLGHRTYLYLVFNYILLGVS